MIPLAHTCSTITSYAPVAIVVQAHPGLASHPLHRPQRERPAISQRSCGGPDSSFFAILFTWLLSVFHRRASLLRRFTNRRVKSTVQLIVIEILVDQIERNISGYRLAALYLLQTDTDIVQELSLGSGLGSAALPSFAFSRSERFCCSLRCLPLMSRLLVSCKHGETPRKHLPSA